ncbi:hypothetical protein Kisp01_15770 [Kineosporia sp. NBRC 101677]|uniref:sigma-70 family RNA polymerase sigma factor n=1 Tax=Kineosporia sp. NBRC 101677 TaxID=3032197 RepID=UPI0024A2F1CE|nr:sigma-70 family RNA polymerase sigma factor [Kineosporia sp. NBRC 101677]GLY14562.1 hypothetical protein Kisp01_15770 [Kineosporia sp. NBRC 101677]
MQDDEPVGVPPGAGGDGGLVRAAQAGDQAALQELLARYVVLVHNLVGRSVSRPADAEDVTQEVLLQVVQDLPTLQSPASFRSWLVAITSRRIADHQRRVGAEPLLPAVPAEPAETFEDLLVLRLDLQGQQRDLVRAGRWLDPEHRALLALWWQECAGRISRAEIANALELGEAHTAVRLQRMREQLEQCRLAVAALDREPRCGGLVPVLQEWTGQANPLWRKRITKHVRTCVVCLREAEDQLPASRLIAGLQLLPLPAALVAGLIGKGLLAPESGPIELTTATIEDDRPDWEVEEPERGAWAAVKWAGRVATVTAAATLLLFTGGFLYDVNRPPTVRSEHPVGAEALSASLSTSPPAVSVSPTPPPAPAKTAKAPAPAVKDRCDRSGLPSRVWPAWTMPNSGADLPSQQRYSVREDGTVRDQNTCLTWQRETPSGRYTFAAAKKYCANLTLAEGNWHLPTRVQLTSIIDTTRLGPAIDPEAFPGTPVSFFWTASPWATPHDPAFAWIVNFYEGLTSNAADQSGEFAVRCVQSPSGQGSVQYEVNGDEVSDPMTGLTWQRATSPTMAAGEAAAYCAGLKGGNWRLPGVQELATLVDESLVGPAIDREAFPSTPARGWYWAANRAAEDEKARWALNYDDGYTNYRDLDAGVVRCVRNQ